MKIPGRGKREEKPWMVICIPFHFVNTINEWPSLLAFIFLFFESLHLQQIFCFICILNRKREGVEMKKKKEEERCKSRQKHHRNSFIRRVYKSYDHFLLENVNLIFTCNFERRRETFFPPKSWSLRKKKEKGKDVTLQSQSQIFLSLINFPLEFLPPSISHSLFIFPLLFLVTLQTTTRRRKTLPHAISLLSFLS